MKINRGLFLFLILIHAPTAFCDDLLAKKSFFENIYLGAQIINYRYTEPSLISHSGYLSGVFGEATWILRDHIHGILDAELSAGNLDYNGSICDVNTNICSDYKAKTNNFIFKLSHRFNFIISDTLDLFLGPGFRYLYDKGSGAGFYTRIGSYLYIPFGLVIKFPGFAGLISLDLEYDLFLSGTMKSKISEVNSTFSDVLHKQTKGLGSKILLKYERAENPWFGVLYYENWSIAESNIEPLLINGTSSGSYLIEPKNFTDAVSFGLGYKF